MNSALSRKYVFASYARATTTKTLPKFAIIAGLGLCVTTVVSVMALDLLQRHFPLAEQLATALAVE